MRKTVCFLLCFCLFSLSIVCYAEDVESAFQAREDSLMMRLIFGGNLHSLDYPATGKFEGKYPEGYDQEPYPDVITDNLDKLKMDKEIYICEDGSAIQSIKLYAAGELVATGCFVRQTDGKYKVYSDRSFI